MKKSKANIFQVTEKSSLKTQSIIKRKVKKKFKKKKSTNSKILRFQLIIFICLLSLFTFCFVIYLLKKILKSNGSSFTLNTYDDSSSNEIIKPYIKAQNDFCENPNKYINQKYEDEITLFDVKLNDLKYQMYVFKSANVIIHGLNRTGSYEIEISTNITKALKFYKEKKNIKDNKDILVLDIGLNVGWYPSLLGRYGYTILGFEAFERNYYVAKKNYCHLNKKSNVIIITKGLGAKEKTCLYFNQVKNAGNGIVICEENKMRLRNGGLGMMFFKDSNVEVTTLDTFMPFLSNKNIAVMKIDVEGHELEVLKGGKDLITKYHVPFVVLEFSPTYLIEIGTAPRELAQFFVDNGYKITIDGFFSKNYITVDYLVSKAGWQVNCYFIHDSINL